MEGDKAENNENESAIKRAGIPEAEFVENVDTYIAKPENEGSAEKALKNLDELYNKYKFMEVNLNSKRRKLCSQIPDLERTINMIDKLEKQKEEFETEYLLSEQVFVKAAIPPTNTVYLWLGANVMLEYTLEDAKKLLESNITAAKKNLNFVNTDLDFIRDQCTTLEVNMARVYNWEAKRMQKAKENKDQ